MIASHAYYNEIDPYAAQWLRNLIAAGHIAPGDVDTRSITDVRADDIRPYTQCHFFAGIGVWSYALRLAGWSDDRPVWTGSCPCQPFSVAGKKKGHHDDRHLWPVWFDLIKKCRPRVVYGEQVEAAIKHGWLDTVHDDMESIGYATMAACIPAAGIGAPHIRSRIWFVGNADNQRLERRKILSPCSNKRLVGQASVAGNPWRAADWLFCRDGKWRPVEPGTFPLADGTASRMGRVRSDQERVAEIPPRKDQGSRVGRLRAYGNAIVPQVAAEIIRATM